MGANNTDQKVDNRAEDDWGDGTHGDVRQDFSQEVDGHPIVAADVLVSVTDAKPNQHPRDPYRFWMNSINSSASCYVHKELPLDDEELGCGHGAETLVCRDEEEGTHPADIKTRQWMWHSPLICLSVINMLDVTFQFRLL